MLHEKCLFKGTWRQKQGRNDVNCAWWFRWTDAKAAGSASQCQSQRKPWLRMAQGVVDLQFVIGSRYALSILMAQYHNSGAATKTRTTNKNCAVAVSQCS